MFTEMTWNAKTADEIRNSRLRFFSFVIDGDQLESVIDLEGYSHARPYGAGESRKVYARAVSAEQLKADLKMANIKPRFGEIEAA